MQGHFKEGRSPFAPRFAGSTGVLGRVATPARVTGVTRNIAEVALAR
ncbi:hypothetical protein [Pyxidicoccus xibeiensis]|nr:hypothetical protein [Pyxidicoccus xibeiensis]MCP3142090.1 hypothetical protein [Pyxidicoccus xibeiensis]